MPAERRFIVAAVLLAALLALLAGVLATRSPEFQQVRAAATRRLPALAPLERLASSFAPPPADVTVSVDTNRRLRSISPLIYGVSVASQAELQATSATLHRWGGNPNTRYNWTLEAWNSARDWEFRNYGGPPTYPSNVADTTVQLNRALGVQTFLTVPAMGWVAKDGDTDTRSVDVPPDGGAPIALGSDAIDGYDPSANRAATSVRSVARKGALADDPPDPRSGSVYQDEWVAHLVRRFGTAAAGGVAYYAIDNEPDLWSYTHTDVHPVRPGYQDMLDVFLEYATAVKDVDPTAHVLGPTLSGWTAYWYSALDRGADAYRTHADRRAHGDVPFLAWWLNAVRVHDEAVGRRSLDVLDVHFYPQGAGVFSAADDATTAALRLRSTRALWDPGYVDESWIAEPVMLIPRLQDWINRYYPGTRLAIGEWNWGAETTMNGALAIADVLGIFGREGVDMAAYWTSPPADSPGARAFSMYTNYDGQGRGFGDRALAAASSAPDYVAAYASVDTATDDVIVIALNKSPDLDLPAVIRLDTPLRGRASIFRLAPGHAEIQGYGDVEIDGSTFGLALPAYSITLLRIQRASGS